MTQKGKVMPFRRRPKKPAPAAADDSRDGTAVADIMHGMKRRLAEFSPPEAAGLALAGTLHYLVRELGVPRDVLELALAGCVERIYTEPSGPPGAG